MDKIEEYIHQEETLKAMVRSKSSRDRLERKMKESRKVDEEDQGRVKKFTGYNFIPLNAEISEEIWNFTYHQRYQVTLLRKMSVSIVISITREAITPMGA